MGKMVIESEFAVGDFVITQVPDYLGHRGAKPCLGKVLTIIATADSQEYTVRWYAGRTPPDGIRFFARDLKAPCARLLDLARQVAQAEAKIDQLEVDRRVLLAQLGDELPKP